MSFKPDLIYFSAVRNIKLLLRPEVYHLKPFNNWCIFHGKPSNIFAKHLTLTHLLHHCLQRRCPCALSTSGSDWQKYSNISKKVRNRYFGGLLKPFPVLLLFLLKKRLEAGCLCIWSPGYVRWTTQRQLVRLAWDFVEDNLKRLRRYSSISRSSVWDSGSHLDNCLASNHLQDLSTPLGAIGQGQVDNLSVSGELVQRNSAQVHYSGLKTNLMQG